MNFCPNCGSKQIPKSKFCSNCGNKNDESNEFITSTIENEIPMEKVVSTSNSIFLSESILDNNNKLKYGFINGKGEWIIQPMFDYVLGFYENDFCNAQLNGKYGKINKQGQWVIFARYAGSRLPIEGGEVRILNDDEVLGTIQNPENVLHHN